MAVCLWSGALAHATAQDEWSSPRDLPSLVVFWQADVEACVVLEHDGAVFMLEPGHLSARDFETGDLLWEAVLPEGDCDFGENRLLVLDGKLSVLAGEYLMLLAPEDGSELGRVELGGRLIRQLGPVLVVESQKVGDDSLSSIDSDRGLVRARILGDGRAWLQADGTLFVTSGNGDDSVAMGLDPLDLSERWRHSGFNGVERTGDRVYLVKDAYRSHRSFAPVQPTTGELGRPVQNLPRASSETIVSGELTTSGQRGRQMTRTHLETDRVVWTREFPRRPAATLRIGDELFVHSGGFSERGILVVLDWNTGAMLRSAYSLRRPKMQHVNGRLLLNGSRSVKVVSASELGPPESETISVEDAVERLLNSDEDPPPNERDYQHSFRRRGLRDDLMALGADALPVLARRVADMDADRLSVVATLLADQSYRAASPLLIERLARTDDPPSAVRALVGALGQLESRDAVPLIAAVLSRDDSELSSGAFKALANIGGEQADAAILAFVDEPESPYRPEFPSPARYLEHVGTPFDRERYEAADESDDTSEIFRILDGSSSAEASSDGRTLVVFQSSRFGSRRDLWAIHRKPGGELVGEAFFLGPLLPAEGCYHCSLTATLNGDELRVTYTGSETFESNVNIVSALTDSDDDGFSDLLEERLMTDPFRADTDGDGLSDFEDPQPLSMLRRAPPSETGEILESVFYQWFRLRMGSRGGVAVVKTELPLVLRGRFEPTLSLPPEAADAFKERANATTIYRLSLVEREPRGGWARVQKRPGEVVARFETYRGPLNAAGYLVVLRRVGARWVIRHTELEWIS